MECDLEVHATVPTLAGFIDEQKAKVLGWRMDEDGSVCWQLWREFWWRGT